MSPRQLVQALLLKTSEYRMLSLFISRIHCEILDPSDPSTKLGIVRLGSKENPIYDLSDDKFAEAFSISANVVMHSRESLRKRGMICQKNTGRGYKLIIRNSDMFNYVARTADNGYSWIYSLPEFASFKPGLTRLETQEKQSHGIGDPSHENGDSDHENGDSNHENGDSGAPKAVQTKPDASLIKRIQRTERIKPQKSSLSSSSNSCGQELLIWLASIGLNLLPDQQATVKEVAKRYPLPVLKRAANACLSGLTIGHSWDHCEKRLAANLELQAEVALRDDEKARATEELVRKTYEKERARAARDLHEAEQRRHEEEELIEESLADPTPPVCTVTVL